MTMEMKEFNKHLSQSVHNVTSYPDMQELILASNAFMSDYSSGIFDAALCKIPCFTYAPDYEEYKEKQGVYYELSELPFPFAKTFDCLLDILKTNKESFDTNKWNAFTNLTGLYETGHAAKDIANLVNEYINGNRTPLDEIQSD